MARSRRLKVPVEDKVRVVLSVLAGEMSAAEAARRRGVSTASVGKWKQAFLEAGTKALDEIPSGPAGAQGTPEQRRLRMESEQLKLALAEATVQLQVWQTAPRGVREGQEIRWSGALCAPIAVVVWPKCPGSRPGPVASRIRRRVR
ncbi:transposase [Nocardia sp. SYP-A9097]|uniref:transposase n=1 Tax=Nocardia sp. SYP-A9097 TaxID=2663237 RepID=UPI001E360FFA|nr:helix-turn-helix domain-containing protein [Nocardia sp. SYP-A9097]